MIHGSTRTLSRVKFFTNHGAAQLLVEFKDGRKIRFYRGSISENLKSLGLGVEELYDLFSLAALKASMFTTPREVEITSAIIEEMRRSMSRVLYAQTVVDIHFYTRSQYHDMIVTMSGGGRVRFRERHMLVLMRQGILSRAQMQEVRVKGCERVKSLHVEEDFNEASALFSEYYRACDILGVS